MDHNPQRTVQLVVPTAPEFASVVRVAAVGLAALAQLDLDKTEDLRLAADEMWLYLRSLDESVDTVTFFFTYDKGAVHVRARTPWGESDTPQLPEDHLGWMVLRAITSDAVVVSHDECVEVSATVSHNAPGTFLQ